MTTYTVERSRNLDVPADRLYPMIVDFRQWTRWSPWEDVDPEMERAYSGPESGVGATYAWSGNRKAGAGRMEILRTDAPHEVEISLRFEKPFRSENVTTFTLTPVVGDGTTVTWRMTGPRPWYMRVLGPVLDMDKLVGRDFEKGLERMELVSRGSRH